MGDHGPSIPPGRVAAPCTPTRSPCSPRRSPRSSRRPVEARAHDHVAAGRAHPVATARRSSTSARTTTSACRSHPRRDRGGARGARRRAASACRACASSAARRICHKELEAAISKFLGTEDTILYALVLRRERRPVRDAARRGGRDHLRRAQPRVDHRRHPPVQGRAPPLRARRPGRPRGDSSQATQGKRLRMIATDGVFSMDGDIARLDAICDLAEKYGAMVMVDDTTRPASSARPAAARRALRRAWTASTCITSTLGKALGGASGGFTTGKQEIVDLLRQRSRPYLFSNTLAPPIVAALARGARAAQRVDRAARQARGEHAALPRRHDRRPASTIRPGHAPDRAGHARRRAARRRDGAARCSTHGIYVIGFSFPVVPKGQARIRVQLSAAHSEADVDRAIAAFATVGRELGVVK